MNASPLSSGTAHDDPIKDFSRCHAGIIAQFARLRELPALCAQPDQQPAQRVAQEFIDFFSDVIIEHHEEEEHQLFPTVTRHAAAGDEKELVITLVKRLREEHKALEAQWKKLAPEVRRLAKGKSADVDAQELRSFADAYVAHAKFEEAAFMPLSTKVLGPHGLAGLALQIHAKHVLDHMPAYI